MSEAVCIDGELVSSEDARVSVFDSGFTQGIGLFETMRSYDGVVFRMERHLDRLRESAQILGWAVLPTIGQMWVAATKVVSALPGAETARVRLTVTTGSLREVAGDEPKLTVVATAAVGGDYPAEFYVKGVSVAISKYRQSRRDPTAGHKTTSYFARLAALREAHAAGAIEALWFTDDNMLAEGSISSVFIVQGERLLTPPLETPILPGITRAAVIDLALASNIPISEQELTIDDLLSAHEVFLTNSMMEIMPVVLIDRDKVGSGKPGEVADKLLRAYRKLVREECDDAAEE
ncbi:MAG: aminotransferase class IV [Planctomycetes bacterium]|nr:aminotransferase class IV [Planctomycetota bacterium]